MVVHLKHQRSAAVRRTCIGRICGPWRIESATSATQGPRSQPFDPWQPRRSCTPVKMQPDCGRTLRHPTASCSPYGRRPWTTNGPPSGMEEGGKREPISMSPAPPTLGDGGLSRSRSASAIATAFLATRRWRSVRGLERLSCWSTSHRKYVDCRARRGSLIVGHFSLDRGRTDPTPHRAVSIASGRRRCVARQGTAFVARLGPSSSW